MNGHDVLVRFLTRFWGINKNIKKNNGYLGINKKKYTIRLSHSESCGTNVDTALFVLSWAFWWKKNIFIINLIQLTYDKNEKNIIEMKNIAKKNYLYLDIDSF